MTDAYQRMFTNFPAHLSKSGQPFTRPTVKASEVLGDNPSGLRKIIVRGDPCNWMGHAWERDTQARPGEYDSAPEVEDPENFHWQFSG